MVLSPRIGYASRLPDAAPVRAEIILGLGQLAIARKRGRHGGLAALSGLQGEEGRGAGSSVTEEEVKLYPTRSKGPKGGFVAVQPFFIADLGPRTPCPTFAAGCGLLLARATRPADARGETLLGVTRMRGLGSSNRTLGLGRARAILVLVLSLPAGERRSDDTDMSYRLCHVNVDS